MTGSEGATSRACQGVPRRLAEVQENLAGARHLSSQLALLKKSTDRRFWLAGCVASERHAPPALELSESPNVTVPNLDPWRVLRETCDCSDTEEKARVENEPSRKHQRQGRHAQLEESSNIRQGLLPFFVGVFACQAPFHRRLHLNITGEARW